MALPADATRAATRPGDTTPPRRATDDLSGAAARPSLLRLVGLPFGVELLFSILVPIAYVRLFDIDDGTDRRHVLALLGALHLLKTAALVVLLIVMLRPVDRWRRRAVADLPDSALLEAGAAAYRTPESFALVWALAWGAQYLVATALLVHFAADTIPLYARAMSATVLFAIAVFAAALPMAYTILGWLLAPVAGAVSLATRERGLAVRGRGSSLQVRLVVLGICLATAPTSWMGLTAYMSETWSSLREMRARARRVAADVATRLAAPGAAVEVELDPRGGAEVPFLARDDGSVVAGGALAQPLLDRSPWLARRFVADLATRDAGSIADRRRELALAFQRTPTGVVGVVASHAGSDAGADWLTLLLFAVVAVCWAPICAGFLAGAMAGPLRRIRVVTAQIMHHEDMDQLERVPIFFRDEIGDLGEDFNEMVDRLQESSGRIKSYSAERERLLTEAARRAAQLQAILDNIVDCVFACDADGRLTLINASALTLLGLTTPEHATAPPSLRLAEFARLHRISHASGRPFRYDELPLVRALRGDIIVQEEELLEEPKSRRTRSLRATAAPIRNQRGAIIGAVEVARDVTEVVELDQLKDQFLRVAAHELKTPVAIMKGFALTLLRAGDDLTPQRRKMVDAIHRGADRIQRIVEDLIETSQVFLDMMKLAEEPLDLGELVAHCVDEAKARATRSAVRLEPCEPATVRGDRHRLRRVVEALLDNAIRYSPNGGDIDVVMWRGPADVVVEVRDHGVGIPRDKQARIFELFYRAHTDTAHDYGGMGVGAYLSREMIARQGGKMWFESDEGRGSTFAFSLPVLAGPAPTPAEGA